MSDFTWRTGIRALNRGTATAPDPAVAEAIRRDAHRHEELAEHLLRRRRNLETAGQVEAAIGQLDMVDVVFAEIEMAQRRRDSYVFDYDAFAECDKTVW